MVQLTGDHYSTGSLCRWKCRKPREVVPCAAPSALRRCGGAGAWRRRGAAGHHPSRPAAPLALLSSPCMLEEWDANSTHTARKRPLPGAAGGGSSSGATPPPKARGFIREGGKGLKTARISRVPAAKPAVACAQLSALQRPAARMASAAGKRGQAGASCCNQRAYSPFHAVAGPVRARAHRACDLGQTLSPAPRPAPSRSITRTQRVLPGSGPVGAGQCQVRLARNALAGCLWWRAPPPDPPLIPGRPARNAPATKNVGSAPNFAPLPRCARCTGPPPAQQPLPRRAARA